MLSLRELRRAAHAIDRELADARVERWVQPDRTRIAVQLYAHRGGEGRKRVLELCVDGEVGRVAELSRLPAAPQNMPAFAAWLRSHLARARLVAASIAGHERELRLAFESQEGRYTLLLALFGRRGNLYVLDAGDRIVLALRPLAESRPELEVGASYAPPESGLPREGDDRFEMVADDALLAAIGEAYAGEGLERAASNLERSLRQALKRERKSAARRLEKLEEELSEADEASVLQRHGELLKGALSRIAPGATEVAVEDYETGEQVVIPLDPKLTPRDNLEATFKRYQKLVRRLTKAGGQVDEARAWCERLSELEARLAAAVASPEHERAAELEALAADPQLSKLVEKGELRGLPPNARAREETAKLPARLRGLATKLVPRRYVSRDGLEIWVGRSDAANDYLTTRLARGNDLFFHLDGAPGSHVVLCVDGSAEPPPESVLDACELAVHFSKQKNASRADVHVVPIKRVKKPKGAKPGLVYVTGGRSVHLRRDAARLERLLDSRIGS